MERLLEYAVRHPLLFGGTVALALAVAAYDFSKARSGGQSIGPTEAVNLPLVKEGGGKQKPGGAT